MICLIALVVFGILGIFSVGYRKIAREAFDCIFRRVTFRPCTSGLDVRLKSGITGKLMQKSPRVAGAVYRHFEVISWFFTVLMIVSIILSARGMYYLVKYGNCNGPQGGICIFSPQNNHPSCTNCSEGCSCQICDGNNATCVCNKNESQQDKTGFSST